MSEPVSIKGGYPQSFIYGGDALAGRLARFEQRKAVDPEAQPLVAIIERHDGLLVELDVDSADHGLNLARAWIMDMQQAHSVCVRRFDDRGSFMHNKFVIFDYRAFDEDHSTEWWLALLERRNEIVAKRNDAQSV